MFCCLIHYKIAESSCSCVNFLHLRQPKISQLLYFYFVFYFTLVDFPSSLSTFLYKQHSCSRFTFSVAICNGVYDFRCVKIKKN